MVASTRGRRGTGDHRPFILPDFSNNTGQYVMLSLACAVGALFIVLGTLAAPWAHDPFAALSHADPAVPAAT